MKANQKSKYHLSNENKNLRNLMALARGIRDSSAQIQQLIERHFGKLTPFKNPSRKTEYCFSRLKHGLFRHFFIDQGSAREYIYRGVGKERRLVEASNRAFIANRAALISQVKTSALVRLVDHYSVAGPKINPDLQKEYDKFQQKIARKRETRKFRSPCQKILTFDIANLRAIDLAGQGDFLLNQVATELIIKCQLILDMLNESDGNPSVSAQFIDEDGNPSLQILPFRIGGDEFSILIEAADQSILDLVLPQVKDLIIENGIKLIETEYGPTNDENKFRTGLVEIKNNKLFDESRPEIVQSDDESKVRALVYDLLLCEINLIPEPSHIDYAMDEIRVLEGETLLDQFNIFFKQHWEKIISQPTALSIFYTEKRAKDDNIPDEIPDFDHIPEEDLLEFCIGIAEKFPGVKILVDLAIKTDTCLSSDLNTPNQNFQLRYLAEFLSEFMYDPVLNELAYNKHAFDELVKAQQLNGLIVFKEVIKVINDNLGLANGDAVIREFFKAIKMQIPVELQKYVVYGRGQADILIGFNTQMLTKLSSEDRVNVMEEINQTIEKLGLMSEFKCALTTKYGLLNFNLNTGVGTARLNQITGYLEPPEFEQCFEAAEKDFDIKYLEKILKDDSFTDFARVMSLENIDSQIKQNPDLWNLHIYLKNPKRGSINCLRILGHLNQAIKDNLFKDIDQPKLEVLKKILSDQTSSIDRNLSISNPPK